MGLPLLWFDPHTGGLSKLGTGRDLERQGVALSEGMRAVFYCEDAEDGTRGYRHGLGSVQRSDVDGAWVANVAKFHFTVAGSVTELAEKLG